MSFARQNIKVPLTSKARATKRTSLTDKNTTRLFRLYSGRTNVGDGRDSSTQNTLELAIPWSTAQGELRFHQVQPIQIHHREQSFVPSSAKDHCCDEQMPTNVVLQTGHSPPPNHQHILQFAHSAINPKSFI